MDRGAHPLMYRARLVAAAVVALTLSCGAARPADAVENKGALVFAGGELRFDNCKVWKRFVELAGGQGAPVVVVPSAARDPVRSGLAAVQNLKNYGAKADLVPI